MPERKTSSKAAKNSTRTAPTHLYRCHLSASHPISTSSHIELTDIVAATSDEHALGVFLAKFRKNHPYCNVRVGSITVALFIPINL